MTILIQNRFHPKVGWIHSVKLLGANIIIFFKNVKHSIQDLHQLSLLFTLGLAC